MKTKTFVIILILVLAVLIIIGGCATTSKTKEEREVVNQEVFIKSVTVGDIAEVKKLIEAGADVNAQNNEGWTVLMLASYFGHPEVAKLLIKEGAEVTAQDNEGWTALLWAAEQKHQEVVKLLIKPVQYYNSIYISNYRAQCTKVTQNTRPKGVFRPLKAKK